MTAISVHRLEYYQVNQRTTILKRKRTPSASKSMKFYTKAMKKIWILLDSDSPRPIMYGYGPLNLSIDGRRERAGTEAKIDTAMGSDKGV